MAKLKGRGGFVKGVCVKASDRLMQSEEVKVRAGLMLEALNKLKKEKQQKKNLASK